MVELLFAVLLVGFLFATVYTGIVQTFVITRDTQEHLRACQILQDKTETIRLYTWDQVTNTSFMPTSFTNVYDPTAGTTNAGVTYNGTLSISNSGMSASYASDIRVVTVTVSWTSGKITNQQSMTTQVSHYGLQNYIYY
jgi:hypothetical protein